MIGPRMRSLTAVALALPLLAGCAAGLDAQTYQERVSSTSSQGQAGTILLNGVMVDTESYNRVEPGTDAVGYAALANVGETDDTLVSVTSPDAEKVEIIGPDGKPTTSLTIPAGGQVLLTPAMDRGKLRLTGLTKSLVPGDFVELTFSFGNNPDTTIDAVVRLPQQPLPRETPTGEAEAEH